MPEIKTLTIDGIRYDVVDDGAVRKVTGKGLSTNDYTDTDKAKLDGIDTTQLVTKAVDDLVNYYLKSETYTKAEVQQLIAAIQGTSFVSVATLPTASAETMGGKIYLVPSANPQTQNVKDEYITIESEGSYSWEQIGSTEASLDGYVTDAELTAALADYTTTATLTTLLAAKQDVISDLATIRSGAAAGATAYQKPASGIPKTDMAQGVKDSLALADSALQSFTETDPTVPSWAKQESKPSYTAQEVGALPANTPIPSALSDLSDDTTHRVVTDTEKSTWNGKQDAIADLAAIRTGAGLGATAYQKPSTGIPASDLAAGVIPDVSGKADKVSSPTAGNFAGLDANGNLTDSGSKASDFATAAQGALAASAYQKPASGIPASDLASGVIPDVSGKEDTSNKVTSLSSSSTNTQYPAAKTVYDEVHPATGSSIPDGGLVPNKLYKLGTLTGNVTITFATPADANAENEYKFTFTADSTAPTISWPASVTKWCGNALTSDTKLPNVEASSYYEVSVIDGLGVFNKFE